MIIVLKELKNNERNINIMEKVKKIMLCIAMALLVILYVVVKKEGLNRGWKFAPKINIHKTDTINDFVYRDYYKDSVGEVVITSYRYDKRKDYAYNLDDDSKIERVVLVYEKDASKELDSIIYLREDSLVKDEAMFLKEDGILINFRNK